MTDHFQDKAQGWEQRETTQALSTAIGQGVLSHLPRLVTAFKS